MEFLTNGKAISALVCALSIVSSVNSQCCDFEATNCNWNLGSWYKSTTNSPDFTYYGNFVATQPSPNYMFRQDGSGSVISTSPFSIPSQGTAISFDYFFGNPNPDPLNYFQVYFTNTANSFTILLTTVSGSSTVWRHIEIQCDGSRSYCCGGSNYVPCQGNIQVTAYVDSTKPQALFAIDNIGTCEPVPSTTPTVPTLPPPNPGSCCQFESDLCGLTLYNWFWSAQTTPTDVIPTHSGNYLWSNVIGSRITSSMQDAVAPNTLFSFTYYISSPNVQLYAYFQPYADSAMLLTVLGYAGNTFTTYSVLCQTCCGGGTCDGQAYVQIVGSADPFIVAVDNIERDSGCSGSFPCCYFDDTYWCGFKSGTDNGFHWSFDGTAAPYYPPPNPGSHYVYFEAVNYFGPNNLNVFLRSVQVTIPDNVIFRGHIYVKVVLGETSALAVNFNNMDIGIVTQIDSIKDTASAWTTIEFNCDSLHGNCCQGLSTCTGYVEITAKVQSVGDTVMYGVDAFEIESDCSVFPGQGSTNATSLKFQPVLL